MNKRDYTLQQDEIKTVLTAIKHDPRSKVVQRATAIHLLHVEQDALVVAKQLGVSKASIHNWHKRWRSDGIEGLADEARSGRPRKADETYQSVLENTLERHPSEWGYPFQIWTLERLREHMKQETGIDLSIGRLEYWLGQWGYVYRRPKYSLTHKQDTEAKEQMEERLNELKKEVNKALSSSSLWTKQA
jgi:transposase